MFRLDKHRKKIKSGLSEIIAKYPNLGGVGCSDWNGATVTGKKPIEHPEDANYDMPLKRKANRTALDLVPKNTRTEFIAIRGEISAMRTRSAVDPKSFRMCSSDIQWYLGLLIWSTYMARNWKLRSSPPAWCRS
ncbi:hypothetical protein BST61_g7779 [Cercospora zeina]